jgi:hypothetical protein
MPRFRLEPLSDGRFRVLRRGDPGDPAFEGTYGDHGYIATELPAVLGNAGLSKNEIEALIAQALDQRDKGLVR